MRYEIVELLLDNSVEVILSTSSKDYAMRYLNFMNFKFGDYRNFYLKDNKDGKIDFK